MTPGADSSVAVARVQTGAADIRYLSVYLLRRARRNLHFDSSKLGNRPRTGEFIVPLTNSLLLQSPSLRSCGLQVAGRRPVLLMDEGWPCIKKGRDGSLKSMSVFLLQRRGAVFYRALYSVLYSRGKRTPPDRPLCSVLCSRGGGTALNRPLCSV